MAITTLNNRAINRSDTASADQLWTATSATASDFQAPAAGGKILQVVSVTWKDAFSSTAITGTFATITGATLAITPSATSSKILFQSMLTQGTQTNGVFLKLQRGGSDIAGALGTVSGSRIAATGYSVGGMDHNGTMQSTYISYLDSPASTSAQTYTLQGSSNASGTWTINYPYGDDDGTYTAHGVSTITLMEIGA